MIPVLAMWRAITRALLGLRSSPIPSTFLRLGVPGRWYEWARERRRLARWRAALRRAATTMARARLRYAFATGAMNMAAATLPGYLRIRVINPRAINFSDGFETAPGANATLWHSLGTEAGTDNSINYWTVLNGAAWSFASHLASSPASVADNILGGGHAGWDNTNGGVLFECRVNTLVTGLGIMTCVGGTGDGYLWQAGGANILQLYKRVAGVYTQIGANQSFTFTQGNPVWLKIIVASAGAITCSAALDSAGAPGTYTNFGFTDSTFTSGRVGLRDSTGVAHSFGGNFPNVCRVTGPLSDGWWPGVTTGEPAFAWSQVTPFSGSRCLSIYLQNSAGNGSLQRYLTWILAGNNTLSCQAKAGVGTANVSGGGLTTGNAVAGYSLVSATGQMTANPIISLNYSGAASFASFDALSVTIDPTVAEITNDLPHLQQSTWTVTGMQPGNPSSAALGSFSIPLHPPGSPGYAVAKPIYDKLDRYMRVEGYLGYSSGGAIPASSTIPLTNMKFAGIIEEIRPFHGGSASSMEIRGKSDLVLVNLSPTFPGEVQPNVVTSAAFKAALAWIELGGGDAFNPFTAGNYVSTKKPGATAGSWSGTNQDGMTVVSCSTGTGACLLSQAGGAANDTYHSQYIEATGTLTPSSDAANAGRIGVGLSGEPTDCNTGIFGYVTAKKNASTGRWDLDAEIEVMANGATWQGPFTASNVLTSVDEPNGNIPLTIGLLMSLVGTVGFSGQATLIVNGKPVISQVLTLLDPATLMNWPFLFSGTPASGSATAYLTNLAQFTRYSGDLRADAPFVPGSVTTTTTQTQVGNPSGPTLLDLWTQMATREGFYWRYTPQPWVAGTRTLGTVDFNVDPGSDLTAKVRFTYGQNLVSLGLTASADAQTPATSAISGPASGSGGIAPWRDIATMRKWGPLADQTLAVTAYGFPALRRFAKQTVANKILTGSSGSKTAEVLRDPDTADKWRELDHILLHDPEINVNYLAARILERTFTEGAGSEQLVIDQFSVDDPRLLSRRHQQGVFQAVSQYTTR